MAEKKISQLEFVLQYFKKRPGEDIPHPEAVDYVTAEWEKMTGNKLRDPDRMIRKLKEQGYLVKVDKGVYRYEPHQPDQGVDFTAKQKREILARDGGKCQVCGSAVDVSVDHIVPRARGGKATLENGQTLCGVHHNRKQNYGQTESGKRMFIRLLDVARANNDQAVIDFCYAILETYDEYDVNGHVEWQK